MPDYDSNYSSKTCPYCFKSISENRREESWVDDLEDEDFDFFQCQKCKKFFKATLNIYKEYDYSVYKPTKIEIKQFGLIVNKDKDIIEDCPGQTFMWRNLFSHKS